MGGEISRGLWSTEIGSGRTTNWHGNGSVCECRSRRRSLGCERLRSGVQPSRRCRQRKRGAPEGKPCASEERRPRPEAPQGTPETCCYPPERCPRTARGVRSEVWGSLLE